MPEVVFISVVRDFATHEKCMAALSGDARVSITAIDNRNANDPIPVQYNRFLDAYDFSRPTWFVFCHEDFECKEDVVRVLQGLSRDFIYGPIGARFRFAHGIDVHVDLLGRIEQSNRDGTNLHELGAIVSAESVVDTLDCCCLILHSSLVEKCHLRFDERFLFDLYVEDFCVSAKERWSILSKAINLKCRHWSGGELGDRYYAQLKKFNNKWPNATYASTCIFSIGGGCSYRWLVGKIKNCGLKTWLRKRFLWR